jgi:hypothetical protein
MQESSRFLMFYMSTQRACVWLGLGTGDISIGSGNPLARLQWLHSMQRYLLAKVSGDRTPFLSELIASGNAKPGAVFIHHGPFRGKGFNQRNKLGQLSMISQPSEGLSDSLVLNFGCDGLLNDTAWTRLGSRAAAFVIAYITATDDGNISAIPIAIGDLIEESYFQIPLNSPRQLWMDVGEIKQFKGAQSHEPVELSDMQHISEHQIKHALATLLGESDPPKDWGGEMCDFLSSNLHVDRERKAGAFLLKGPSRFREMEISDCGKNGDQIVRLFEVPADIYVVQHCHRIGARVRATMEAFALRRFLIAPCRIIAMDGYATLRLLKLHGFV